MERVEFLVVGAGVSGLAFANEVKGRALVVEREAEPGGYCRTVVKDGFVWDYSGHFFHFQRPDIDAWMRERMSAGTIRTITKRTRVRPAPDDALRETDFPFQTHIHQLPAAERDACLADLRAARGDPTAASSFKEMLQRTYGRGICEKFLVPYNEKLYATDLDRLDKDAMGRFFPHPKQDALVEATSGTTTSYNATFTYPTGGAVEYVRALLRDLPEGSVACGEAVERIDLEARVAHTSRVDGTRGAIAFDHVVTSAPLPSVLRACGVAHDAGAFTANQVLVFNLGFDAKGRDDVHWMYFGDPSLAFYRVGFYDNILGTQRMSLYVEVGFAPDAVVDARVVVETRARVLADLARTGIATTQQLVAEHHVVMRPAYVHITKRSNAEAARTRALLAEKHVHAIGRYGGWTYCSIEDDIVEARALANAIARR